MINSYKDFKKHYDFRMHRSYKKTDEQNRFLKLLELLEKEINDGSTRIK